MQSSTFKLSPSFARPVNALWASLLNGGDILLLTPLFTHFQDKLFYLFHFRAVYCYYAICRHVTENPHHYGFLVSEPPQSETAFAAYSRTMPAEWHQAVIDAYLKLELPEFYPQLRIIYVDRDATLPFQARSGVSFLRDAIVEDADGNRFVLVGSRSPLAADGISVVDESFKVIPDGPRLTNGTFWVGGNYLLAGVSELIKTNGESAPDTVIMAELESRLHTFEENELRTVLWVQPQDPIIHDGRKYYYPLSGHLDDFISPLASVGNADYYLYADLSEQFYCGERGPLQPAVIQKQIPLLNAVSQNLSSQLGKLGKRFCPVQLPVLWDDAAFYSYTNCITEIQNETLVLHLPQFRLQGEDKFNATAIACEQEIEKRLSVLTDFRIQIKWLKDFGFVDYIRSYKGSLHCMLNAL